MVRVSGWSHRQLFAAVDKLDEAMAAELHSIVHRFAPKLVMKVITAAASDGDVPFIEVAPPVNWEGLTLIQQWWIDAIAYNFLPQVTQSYMNTAQELYKDIIDVHPDVEATLPPVTNAASEQYLIGAKNRMVNVGDQLWSTISTQLQDGVAKGEGIEELKARLIASAGLTEPRARTVARTEVISASNAGSFAQAQLGEQVGLVMKKEWLATEDMRTRPTHALADGQKQDMSAPFDVGGSSLMFPGDPSGPAGEVINCRCTIAYDVDDELDPLAITAAGPKMFIEPTWKWDGLTHHEFCKSPLHPGPCKGAHPSTAKSTHNSKKYPKKHSSHAAKHAGAGGGTNDGGESGQHEHVGAPKSLAEDVTSHPVLNNPHATDAEINKTIDDLAAKHGVSKLEVQKLQPDLYDIAPVKTKGESLPHNTKADVYQSFKGHKNVSPAYSGKAIYDSMQHAKEAHPDLNLSDADVLDIIDEQGTHMGHTAKAGPSAYKDKVVAWLQTPNGKKAAVEHLKTQHVGEVHTSTAHPKAHESAAATHVAPTPVTNMPVATHGPLTPEAAAISEKFNPSAMPHADKLAIQTAFIKHAGDIPDFQKLADESFNGNVEAAVHHHQLMAFETTGKEHGLTTLETIKAVDSLNGTHDWETELVGHVKEHGAPAAPPIPKPKKIAKEDLPNGDWAATGYKGLQADVKMKLGTSANAHLLPSSVKDAVYLDITSGLSKSNTSIYDPNGEKLAAVLDDVAAKHGISQLQAVKIFDKKQSSGWKVKQTHEKKLYAYYKGSSVGVGAGKTPSKTMLSTDKLDPAKKSILGNNTDPSHFSDVQKNTVWQAMSQQGVYASSSNSVVFNSAAKVGTHLGYSPHEVLKMFDETSAEKMGVANEHLFEAKGIKHVKQAPLVKLIGQGTTATVYHGVIKVPLSAPHPVPIPANKTAAPGTEFKIIDNNEALKMQVQMGDFTPSEKSALKLYTSSYYKDINSFLRSGGTSHQNAASAAAKVQASMRPITHDLVLRRGASVHGFGLTSIDDLHSLVGKTYEDRGFLSTSVGGKAAFGGEISLTVHAPKGTHAAYVDPFSHYKGENELLLAAGTRYKVISVTPPSSTGYGQWNVLVEVVGDEPNHG